MELKRPHDSFFKQLMSDPDVVKEFLRGFLPVELSSRLEYDTVRLIDTEKTDKKYRKFHLDLSVECMISGFLSEIYIVFEHKSYPDKFTLIQILNYMSVVWEGCLKNKVSLIPIIPLVFYHGSRRFDLPTEFHEYFSVEELLKQYLLNFRILLFDTTKVTDDEILSMSNDLYLTASLLLMKHIFDDLKGLRPVFKHLVYLDRDRFLMVLQYVIMTKDIKEGELEEILEGTGGEVMPTLAQRWLEQGIQQGIREGIREGIRDAQEMVLEAIDAKFGRCPEYLKEKIISIADRIRLKELHREILLKDSLEEISLN